MNDSQRTLLNKHLDLVIEANKKTNLTNITDKKQGQLLHIEDSLVGLPELEEAPSGLYGDLGSGAGYPGLPLSVLSKRQTVLVEAAKRKAECLGEFISQLDLDALVSVFHGRTEELALERPESFAVLSARALSSLSSLIELASPLLQESGVLICYKSAHCAEEIERADDIAAKVAMYRKSKRTVMLSDGETSRSIVTYEKKGKPLVSLPRRSGMAQKRPYTK